jgi:hypothetical protein
MVRVEFNDLCARDLPAHPALQHGRNRASVRCCSWHCSHWRISLYDDVGLYLVPSSLREPGEIQKALTVARRERGHIAQPYHSVGIAPTFRRLSGSDPFRSIGVHNRVDRQMLERLHAQMDHGTPGRLSGVIRRG